MKDYPRLFPIWFLPSILLIIIVFGGPCGCKTGGKWVSSGSTGAKQIITPSELERQPNGTFKLKPKDIGIPPGNPVSLKPPEVKSTPIKLESAVTKPTPPKPISAKAKNLPPADVKSPSFNTAPFKPTVTTITPKVNVRPIKNPPTKIINGDGGCVKTGEPQVAGPCKMEPKKEAPVTVKWMELFAFYFLAIMLAVFCWILYDIYKQYRKAKANDKSKKTPTKKKKAPLKRKRGRPKKKSS